MKALRFFAILIIILLLAGVGGLFYVKNYYNDALSEKSGSGEIVEVVIPEGTGAEGIATILKEKGLIDSTLVFRYYLKDTGKGADLKAGSYEFFDNQSVVEIVDELVKGARAKGIKVTIPEGLRYDEITTIIANRFKEQGVETFSNADLDLIVTSPDDQNFGAEVNAFLTQNKPAGKNLEGFLFPNTYEFAKDAKAIDIITKLLETYLENTENIVSTNSLTYYENLTMASIVEREANPGEFQEVANILYRRVDEGDRIGADSSALYALKTWDPERVDEGLGIDSPYNTREKYGIPPTPISNPGAASIKAAMNAEPSEYYFFIHDNQGNIHYAKTLPEHDANIRKYLR